ncbi:MAG: adenylate/guanylate cyclase domain-containing protein [Myxococcales bacterium]
MPPSETTIARAELARRQEQLVLAAGQLAAERRAAVARFLVVALVGLAVLVFPDHDPRDPLMAAVGPLYTLFAAGSLWKVFHTEANLGRARTLPFVLPIVDYGFLTFASWRMSKAWGGAPEHAASIGALYLAFALLRTPWSILFSTVLAGACYALLAWHWGTLGSFGTATVLSVYLSLGVLLWRSNAALRGMFLSLRRRDNLSRFLPAPLVERLLDGGEAALQPVQREVTVLFFDVRNFTAMSERLAPREVLEFLDDLLGRMSQIVKAHDGLVNKFLGDGMLAFWGVPAPKDDHARAALRAALDMRRELDELNAVRQHHGLPVLRMGIGIHTGPVAAGMLGGAEQHEYTIIGDSVNLASRIEGLTKQLGVDILVSERAWRVAGEGFSGERKAAEHVKGREEAVVVYALAAYGADGARAAG